MRIRGFRPVCVLAAFAALSAFGSAGSAQDKQALPKSFPESVVKEWTAAGANTGWTRMESFSLTSCECLERLARRR